MSKASWDHLERAFKREPAFVFPSPEGHVGYPADILAMNKEELESLIQARLDYEAEGRELEKSDDHQPPIPD